MPRTVFDVPALNARQRDLEQLASQSDFWDDQKQAQSKMRQLDEVKAQLEQLGRWQAAIDDGRATLELYDLEPDADLLEESNTALQGLKGDLDRWELERLLSGTYDKEGAVLSINAGAGGTDAQDWALMLMRMYTRWAEDHGMKVSVDELSEGEEAGIKSCTIEIDGRYAYGRAHPPRPHRSGGALHPGALPAPEQGEGDGPADGEAAGDCPGAKGRRDLRHPR